MCAQAKEVPSVRMYPPSFLELKGEMFHQLTMEQATYEIVLMPTPGARS